MLRDDDLRARRHPNPSFPREMVRIEHRRPDRQPLQALGAHDPDAPPAIQRPSLPAAGPHREERAAGGPGSAQHVKACPCRLTRWRLDEEWMQLRLLLWIETNMRDERQRLVRAG